MPVPPNCNLWSDFLLRRPHVRGSSTLISYTTLLSSIGSSFKLTKWGVPASLSCSSSSLFLSSSSSFSLLSLSLYSQLFSISSICLWFASSCSAMKSIFIFSKISSWRFWPPPPFPPPSASSFLSLSFSALSSRMSLSYGSSLMTALFLIYLARSAYLSVLKVSSKYLAPGLMAHIMYVLELPPSAFCNILVNYEYLYGITTLFPFCLSTNALMTFPNVERLWLMWLASLSLSPVAPV